jgi:hypothetical protein
VRVDAALEVGDVTEVLDVQGEAPVVDTHQVQVGALVDSRRVRELPLNGRNVYDLVNILPGVGSVSTETISTRGGSRLRVNGARATAAERAGDFSAAPQTQGRWTRPQISRSLTPAFHKADSTPWPTTSSASRFRCPTRPTGACRPYRLRIRINSSGSRHVQPPCRLGLIVSLVEQPHRCEAALFECFEIPSCTLCSSHT